MNAAVATAILPTKRKLFASFLSESSPVSHTERRLSGEGGKVVHQIVLGNAPVVGEGGEAALTVRPVTAGSHGQLLVAALTDQGLHLADALLFAPLVLEPDLREERLQKKHFSW